MNTSRDHIDGRGIEAGGPDAPANGSLALRVYRESEALSSEQLASRIAALGYNVSRSTVERWIATGVTLDARDVVQRLCESKEVVGAKRQPLEGRELRPGEFDWLLHCTRESRKQGRLSGDEQARWSRTIQVARANSALVGEPASLALILESQIELAEQCGSFPDAENGGQRRALGLLMHVDQPGWRSVLHPAVVARAADLLGRVHHNLAQDRKDSRGRAAHARFGALCFARAERAARESGERALLAKVLANHARLASMLQPQKNPLAIILAEEARELARRSQDANGRFLASLSTVMGLMVASRTTPRPSTVREGMKVLERGLADYAQSLADMPPLWRHFLHVHRGLLLARDRDQRHAQIELAAAAQVGRDSHVPAWIQTAETLTTLLDSPAAMLDYYRTETIRRSKPSRLVVQVRTPQCLAPTTDGDSRSPRP